MTDRDYVRRALSRVERATEDANAAALRAMDRARTVLDREITEMTIRANRVRAALAASASAVLVDVAVPSGPERDTSGQLERDPEALDRWAKRAEHAEAVIAGLREAIGELRCSYCGYFYSHKPADRWRGGNTPFECSVCARMLAELDRLAAETKPLPYIVDEPEEV